MSVQLAEVKWKNISSSYQSIVAFEKFYQSKNKIHIRTVKLPFINKRTKGTAKGYLKLSLISVKNSIAIKRFLGQLHNCKYIEFEKVALARLPIETYKWTLGKSPTCHGRHYEQFEVRFSKWVLFIPFSGVSLSKILAYIASYTLNSGGNCYFGR